MSSVKNFCEDLLDEGDADEVWVLTVSQGVGRLTLGRLKTNGEAGFFEGTMRGVALGETLMALRAPVQEAISSANMDPMDKLTGEGRALVHEFGNKALGLLMQGYNPAHVRQIMEGK